MDDLSTAESPIASLTQVTKDKLALMLNGRKILPSDDGFPRDWRGLAQCLDCDNDELQQLGRAASPTEALLERCRARPVGALWRALRLLGRLDVQDDAGHLIAADVARYQERLLESSALGSSSAISARPDHADDDLICVGDAECLRTGRPLPTFDAFLLYDDGDVDFAEQIINRMESRGIKLCDKERHLLPGVTFEHQGIMRLMETRCHRVLAVLSPRFLDSAVNKFLAMFSQALGLDKRGAMLLPCVYQKCTLPSYLMYCSRIDFTRGVGLVNAWDKMYETLSMTMAARTRSLSYSTPEAHETPPVPAKTRCDSFPSGVSAPVALPERPPAPAAAEPVRAGRGLLRRLRGRLRGADDSPPDAAETDDAADAERNPEPERRSQLSKLFASKDKQKAKSKAEKKKAAKALVAA